MGETGDSFVTRLGYVENLDKLLYDDDFLRTLDVTMRKIPNEDIPSISSPDDSADGNNPASAVASNIDDS